MALGEEGAGLEELGEEERGVPQIVAEELKFFVTAGVCEREVQLSGQVGGRVEKAMFGITVWTVLVNVVNNSYLPNAGR